MLMWQSLSASQSPCRQSSTSDRWGMEPGLASLWEQTAQRGRLRGSGNSPANVWVWFWVIFLPLLNPDTLSQNTHRYTHTQERKINDSQRPCLEHFFGLPALLVLSPQGSLITQGIERLLFGGVLVLTPCIPEGRFLMSCLALLHSYSQWLEASTLTYFERGRKILRRKLNPNWTPFCRLRPSVRFPTEMKNSS